MCMSPPLLNSPIVLRCVIYNRCKHCSLSHQTQYEACDIMPCLLNNYKQWHPRGSIFFCSTSNSHMWVGSGKRMFTASMLYILSHPPPKTCSLSKRLPEERLWLREKNKETGNQKTKREKCYERVNYSPLLKATMWPRC